MNSVPLQTGSAERTEAVEPAIGGPPATADVPAARRRRGFSGPAAEFLRTAVPLVVAIIVVAVYTNSVNSAFITSNNVQNILVQVSVLGILAVGQTMLVIGGRLDLSVGSMVSMVGVLAAAAIARGWPVPLVVLGCLALGAVVGLLLGLLVTTLRVPPFILTLGFLSVFSSVALIVSSNQPIPATGALAGLGFGQVLGLRTPALALIVLTVLGAVVLHFTRFGRNTYALGSSEQAAYLAGVPTRRVTILLFTLNSTIAAFGGLLLMARLAAGDPRGGSGLELSVIAVIVLGGAALSGGRGTMVGAFLGALLFGAIQACLTFLDISGAYQNLVSGGILVLAVTITAVSDLRAQRAGRPTRLSALIQTLTRRPGTAADAS